MFKKNKKEKQTNISAVLPKTKFKVGDKVQIKSKIWFDNSKTLHDICPSVSPPSGFGYVFTDSNAKYCGRILTVRDIRFDSINPTYILDEVDEHLYWNEYMFENEIIDDNDLWKEAIKESVKLISNIIYAKSNVIKDQIGNKIYNELNTQIQTLKNITKKFDRPSIHLPLNGMVFMYDGDINKFTITDLKIGKFIAIDDKDRIVCQIKNENTYPKYIIESKNVHLNNSYSTRSYFLEADQGRLVNVVN